MSVMRGMARGGVGVAVLTFRLQEILRNRENGYSVSEWAGEENSESLSRESVRNLICLFLGLGRNRSKSSLRIITMSWLVHDLGFEFFTYKIQEPWTVKLSRGASDGSISPIRSK